MAGWKLYGKRTVYLQAEREIAQKHFDRPIPELDTLRATLRGE